MCESFSFFALLTIHSFHLTNVLPPELELRFISKGFVSYLSIILFGNLSIHKLFEQFLSFQQIWSTVGKMIENSNNHLSTNQYQVLSSPKGTMDFCQVSRYHPRHVEAHSSPPSVLPHPGLSSEDLPEIRLQRRNKNDSGIPKACVESPSSCSMLPTQVMFPLKF